MRKNKKAQINYPESFVLKSGNNFTYEVSPYSIWFYDYKSTFALHNIIS
jgi:hypothetical protein